MANLLACYLKKLLMGMCLIKNGIKFGLIYYVGFPINWPDGETFGTVCVMDKNKHKMKGHVNPLSFIEADLYFRKMQKNKPTIEDVLKRTGPAAAWVSTDSDACRPFAVDVVIT